MRAVKQSQRRYELAKLLLIDGNNLAFRVHWTHRTLTLDGMPVSLLYGFFRSLIYLRKKFPGHLVIVAWDSRSKRREAESKAGVQKRLIPTHYKESRHDPDREIPPEIEDMFEQMDPLREALKLIRVLQVRASGYEADDVIYSLAKRNEVEGGHSTVITSDHDYLQILTEQTKVYDAMKDEFWSPDVFRGAFGFEPALWVDCGALMGDKSDEIHGVPGIGEKWALKLIQQYGNIDGVLAGLRAKTKRGKKEQAVLDHEERLRLARSLKQMDTVDDLPSLRCARRQKKPFYDWLTQFKFDSLKEDAWRLVE